MTAEHLEQWRALADAATPGPWLPSHNVDAPSDGNWEPDNPEREGRGEGPTLVGTYRDVKAWAEADAAFIAAARDAVPALLAEVDRLRAELNTATAAIANLRTIWRNGGASDRTMARLAEAFHAYDAARLAEQGAQS